MRIPIQLPEFTGVGVNQKASLSVPLGVAYHTILLNLLTSGVNMTVAQMKSMVDTITVKLNGKPVQEWTPTSLDIANATNGTQYAANNGYLFLHLSEPWRRTMEGEESGAWGTAGLDSFTIEVKFNGTAVAPTIASWGFVQDGPNREIRRFPIRYVRNYTALPVINGVQQLNGIVRDVGLFYTRFHFLSALVTVAKVQINRITKWDSITRVVAVEVLAKRALAMQANTYTLAFDGASQQLTDQLASFQLGQQGPVVVPDFRIEYTGTGAGTTDLVAEQYQTLI